MVTEPVSISKTTEIINNFKEQLKTVKALRLNASNQISEGNFALAIHTQTEVAMIMSSMELKKAKHDFREMLTPIKFAISKEGRGQEFPYIMEYDYGYDATIAYTSILEIEKEVTKI